MRTIEPVSSTTPAAALPSSREVDPLSGGAAAPAPPTPAEMRRAMGAFASGVTVVTGTDGDEAVGFACQSFASVSLEPPLVLFCADHRGRAWPSIRTSGVFCVNVLSEEQAEVCGRFGSARGAKYDGLEWDRSAWGAPALRDVLLRVHCEVFDVHVAGDHDVVIGRVLQLEAGPETRPMIFFRGRFGVDPEPEFAPPEWGWGDRWG
jgi:flavin reductase (DIM6/NTAB) family NADH-FMN oxidoreductase RutF